MPEKWAKSPIPCAPKAWACSNKSIEGIFIWKVDFMFLTCDNIFHLSITNYYLLQLANSLHIILSPLCLLWFLKLIFGFSNIIFFTRYLLIMFRDAPVEVWAMTKNPMMVLISYFSACIYANFRAIIYSYPVTSRRWKRLASILDWI